ncbi:farnesyl pyrophosphate synthase [Trichoderma arundinaceum]|uniref:Farnesyl pyrophosphate synthase n=1 Tax=Trichoderma arundinaceum TaxID=490622 RepID=A0A395NFY5_TRIAR|nr:farnesyl pyrophosphate synthase [Trichoderma arundinaceum]
MKESEALMKFTSIYSRLEEVLLEHATSHGLPQPELEWFKRNLEANPLGGKCNRGMSVPDSVAILVGKPLTEESYFQAATLGWATELLQASFLVSDDIIDGSITRRGRSCWHRMDGVGLTAINDSIMLESAVYILLQRFFRDHPAYTEFMELFHETTFQTEMGQLCDLLMAPKDGLDHFSMDKYRFIVVYKTAYYSFYLPVALALYFLGLATPKNLQQASSILIPMGEYFQIQDDYLDCFGSSSHTGKVGTDIRDNKCSWLVNQALEIVTPAQRKILEENYGQKDDSKEAAVKELFRELNLPERYHEFEEAQVAKIRSMIEKVNESEGLKGEVFEAVLAKIYLRTK